MIQQFYTNTTVLFLHAIPQTNFLYQLEHKIWVLQGDKLPEKHDIRWSLCHYTRHLRTSMSHFYLHISFTFWFLWILKILENSPRRKILSPGRNSDTCSGKGNISENWGKWVEWGFSLENQRKHTILLGESEETNDSPGRIWGNRYSPGRIRGNRRFPGGNQRN